MNPEVQEQIRYQAIRLRKAEKSAKQLSKSLPSRELLFVRGIKNMKKAFNILHQTDFIDYK